TRAAPDVDGWVAPPTMKNATPTAANPAPTPIRMSDAVADVRPSCTAARPTSVQPPLASHSFFTLPPSSSARAPNTAPATTAATPTVPTAMPDGRIHGYFGTSTTGAAVAVAVAVGRGGAAFLSAGTRTVIFLPSAASNWLCHGS